MTLKIRFDKRIVLGLMFLGLSIASAHAQFPMASNRFAVKAGGQAYPFPYERSHDLSVTNDKVEHVIVSIHCSSFNAYRAFQNAEIAISQSAAEREKYLILAPHFLTPDMIRQRISDKDVRNVLHWKSNPFWGGSNGLYNGKKVTVSTFDAVDQLLEEVLTQGHFPNVKDIVVMGLSAGGQMVNRYAASNTLEFNTAATYGVKMRYMVMAPSTYVYMSPERMKNPNAPLVKPSWAPWDYNTWGYGLDDLFEYHLRHKVTAAWVKAHYPQREVLYLVGEKDIDFSDKMLAKNPSAMLQGANRLERGYTYMAYLTRIYGQPVTQTQHFYEIPGVDHNDRPLIGSPQGLAFIFKTNEGSQIADAKEILNSKH